MPRAQKHPAHLRHNLEKLRLDVALKRARLTVIKKDIPRPYIKPKLDPELAALEAQRKAISKQSSILFEQRRLIDDRIKLDREKRKLDSALKEEAYLKSQNERSNRD